MLNKNNNAGISVFFVIVGVVVAGFLGFVGYRFADALEIVGGVSAILTVAGSLSGIMVLLFGFFTLINNMYMSSDIELIITMPFSSVEISIIRIMPLLRTAYGIALVLLVPINIGYAIKQPIDVLSVVGIILGLLLVPIFATAFTAMLVILIMSFVKVLRNVDVLRYIGIVVLFVFMCVMFYFQGSDKKGVDESAVINSVAGIGKSVKYVVPVSGFLVDFTVDKSVISLLIALVITAVAFVLFYVCARGLYLDGALSMQSTKASGEILDDEALSKASNKRDVKRALISKELKMLKRNPAYTLNNFVIGFLWPILAFVMFKGFGSLINVANNYRATFGDSFSLNLTYMLVVTALLILMIAVIPVLYSSVAYTSITREGKSFPIMKQIPVPYEMQIKCKLTFAERLLQIQTTLYVVVIAVIIAIVLKIPVYFAILPVIISFFYTEVATYIDMLFGYKYADVGWDDEKNAARKKGPCMFVHMALMFGVPGIIVIGAFLGSFGGVIMQLIPTIIVFVILLVLMLSLRRRVIVKGEKRIRTLRF